MIKLLKIYGRGDLLITKLFDYPHYNRTAFNFELKYYKCFEEWANFEYDPKCSEKRQVRSSVWSQDSQSSQFFNYFIVKVSEIFPTESCWILG